MAASARLGGLRRLSAQALADLQGGPAQAIQEMRELQGLILNRSRLRLWLMGDRRLLQQARPQVEALVRSFPQRRVGSRVDEMPAVWPRLRALYPELAIGHPAYVGYVHEGSLTGNVVVTAKGQHIKTSTNQQWSLPWLNRWLELAHIPGIKGPGRRVWPMAMAWISASAKAPSSIMRIAVLVSEPR